MTRSPALVLALGALLAARSAQAACPAPVAAADLARQLSSADAAFADLDDAGFRGAVAGARQGLPCVGEPLSAGQVAAWHRAEALLAFLDRDHAATVQHFQAMLGASPGWQLSEELAPDGHPLRTDFDIALGLGPPPRAALAPPSDGSLRVDGVAASTAPQGLPYVLQHLDATGAVRLTQAVEVGATPPDYGAVASAEGSRPTRPAPDRRKARLGPPLVATAVVAGAASAGLYGLSAARVGEFWDPATADGELDRLRGEANGMATASLCAAIVAVGAGTAAVVTFAW